ncbi:hypothetical protein [Paenibacillus odorifer]|uniref:galactose-binding domain-containing protein n=1 Tax=Paenibacillus TaxID=44249 RepID=UPI0015C34121|nr:hypothetical protein [Paenibacillus odorifer]
MRNREGPKRETLIDMLDNILYQLEEKSNEDEYVQPQRRLSMDLRRSCKTYKTNRVVLNWEVAYASGYQTQVSSDGNQWENVYTTTTGKGSIEDIVLNR